jgi:hypothetical protein
MVDEVLQLSRSFYLSRKAQDHTQARFHARYHVKKGHKRTISETVDIQADSDTDLYPQHPHEHPSRLDLHIRMLLGRYLYLGLPLLQSAYALDAAGWRKQTIYQVSIARFMPQDAA